jgi:glyoxylase-like metal-dependent hydrolase (beta-lactamase superfamily II)
LVDTGFDKEMAQRRELWSRGLTLLRPIAECLMAAGIAAHTVKDVIISHMHWDHCGNYDVFPNATYHLQDCEMDFVTGRCMCQSHFRSPFEAEDVSAMVRKVFSDRVVFHDGESQVFPGITVHHIGGHSKGLQAVRVNTRRRVVVLASDAAHLYTHIKERKIFPTTYDASDAAAGYDKLRELATSDHHIIPGHDSKVLQIYPAPNEALKGWVARLDADPAPWG